MIVVIGSANADLVVSTGRLPKPGETVTGGTFYEAPGGKGANQAVAAARAGGAGKVAYCGALGTDPFGDRMLAGLVAEGIDVRAVRREANRPSGVAVIVVDARGENAIAVAPGANLALTEADADAALARRAKVVLVSLEVPLAVARHAIRRGREGGAITILVPAPVPAEPIGDETLARVSILLPNEGEAAALAGTVAGSAPKSLLARGVGAVVMTRGARGALVATREGALEIPSFPVDAVDSVGAGDAFAGALAVALFEGRALPDAARFACAAAAISVTRRGAQPSIPRRAEIDSFLAR